MCSRVGQEPASKRWHTPRGLCQLNSRPRPPSAGVQQGELPERGSSIHCVLPPSHPCGSAARISVTGALVQGHFANKELGSCGARGNHGAGSPMPRCGPLCHGTLNTGSPWSQLLPTGPLTDMLFTKLRYFKDSTCISICWLAGSVPGCLLLRGGSAEARIWVSGVGARGPGSAALACCFQDVRQQEMGCGLTRLTCACRLCGLLSSCPALLLEPWLPDSTAPSAPLRPTVRSPCLSLRGWGSCPCAGFTSRLSVSDPGGVLASGVLCAVGWGVESEGRQHPSGRAVAWGVCRRSRRTTAGGTAAAGQRGGTSRPGPTLQVRSLPGRCASPVCLCGQLHCAWSVVRALRAGQTVRGLARGLCNVSSEPSVL